MVQPPRVALVQTKDPKKQEAGRKGAEARRKKLESLKAELSAANERVHMDYMAELSETYSGTRFGGRTQTRESSYRFEPTVTNVNRVARWDWPRTHSRCGVYIVI